MWSIFWLCFLYLATFVRSEDREERVVRSPQGPVRGFKDPEHGIFAFYGIPYATAPKGPYKFTAPYPPSAWLKPFDAVNKGIICPQASTGEWLPNMTMQEDCLIANVYVPDTKKKKLPVVVYVHGGAFQIGFSNMATPKNLVKSKGIIAVTFNYRLGIHGFLCLGTKDVPGNAGMKDQVALLQWVKKNIESYGGNPEDVTIAGYSAGSSSVDLLMLSRSARGLFNKAIPESGVSIAPFAIQLDPLENAKLHAKTIGFNDVDDFYALEQFYKTASFDLLTTDSFLNRTDTFLFTPCVERDTGSETFLTDSPYNILKKGSYRKVPILYGFSRMEGLFRVPWFDLWKHKMNENFADFLPADLKLENDDEKREVIREIKEFYFDNKPVSEDNILAYIDYFTDVLFAVPTLRAVKLYVESGHSKVFLYEYSFIDESSPAIPYTDNIRGADHCAQTLAVLDGSKWTVYEENDLSEELIKMKTLMRDVWHSFITTGNPVPAGSELPEWPAADAGGSPYMSLGSAVELRRALLGERTRFWHNLYEKHYRLPVAPPTPPHTEL